MPSGRAVHSAGLPHRPPPLHDHHGGPELPLLHRGALPVCSVHVAAMDAPQRAARASAIIWLGQKPSVP